MCSAYYINTNANSVYFQKICINTKQVDKPREMRVFVLIPSPFNTQVQTLKMIIPQANARNLCGHNNPSNAETPCLVASKNNQLIGSPKRIKIHSYLRKESQTNCPFSCNHTMVCATRNISIQKSMFLPIYFIYFTATINNLNDRVNYESKYLGTQR